MKGEHPNSISDISATSPQSAQSSQSDLANSSQTNLLKHGTSMIVTSPSNDNNDINNGPSPSDNLPHNIDINKFKLKTLSVDAAEDLSNFMGDKDDPEDLRVKPKELSDPYARPESDNACKEWCLKYFWVGQVLDEKLETHRSIHGETGYDKYRRTISLIVPIIIVHVSWWSVMGSENLFWLFNDVYADSDIPRYYMSITMLFGSMIAGATSEGGASVAFPIMTLVFGITPGIAVDFSFMIQSVGMTAAAFTILFMRVQVEWKALIYTSIGGVLGIIIGLEYLRAHLDPPYQKMYFVCIWFAFAFSLFCLNSTLDRKVYLTIPDFSWWKAVVLIITGIVGGIFSSIAGSGIDISSFATLTLLFRISEKTATPTSVVLMAINTCVGFLWREFAQEGVDEEAWHFWAVCVPIVVVGAPMGSMIGSHFHRIVLASFVYITDTVQLIGALYVVQPWVKEDKPGKDTPVHLCLSSFAIIVAGGIAFWILTKLGLKLLSIQEGEEEKQNEKPTSTLSTVETA